MVAEQEGGGISGDEGDGTQTQGRTIWDRDDGRKWAEEGYKWLTVKAKFFNASNGVVASTEPGWLQLVFDLLTGLFYRVLLQRNVRKTVEIVCWPCRASGVR